MGLYVCVVRCKECFCAVNGQLLECIGITLPAVVAVARVALAVFISKYATKCTPYLSRNVIFAWDEFYCVLLACFFGGNEARDICIFPRLFLLCFSVARMLGYRYDKNSLG